jgi:hypothetical protein
MRYDRMSRMSWLLLILPLTLDVAGCGNHDESIPHRSPVAETRPAGPPLKPMKPGMSIQGARTGPPRTLLAY